MPGRQQVRSTGAGAAAAAAPALPVALHGGVERLGALRGGDVDAIA